jgi:ABC-type phosphate/phosphonate transport system substrate-binding protein
MQRIAALPNYYSNPPALEAFWGALRRRLSMAGLNDLPQALTWPTDLRAHWRDPALLLGQTCGYPLVTELAGQVRVVGSLCHRAPGCQGARNRSQLVVRADEPATTIAQLRGRTVAYNGSDSQSGYNALRALVAPLAVDGRFFGRSIETGYHLKSAEAVRDGLADIAAIDCVSLAGFRRYVPDSVRGLRVLGETDDFVGLPLITALQTDDATLALLRSALTATIADPDNAATCEDLLLAGFEPLDYAAYDKHLAMRDGAFALGCRSL